MKIKIYNKNLINKTLLRNDIKKKLQNGILNTKI